MRRVSRRTPTSRNLLTAIGAATTAVGEIVEDTGAAAATSVVVTIATTRRTLRVKTRLKVTAGTSGVITMTKLKAKMGKRASTRCETEAVEAMTEVTIEAVVAEAMTVVMIGAVEDAATREVVAGAASSAATRTVVMLAIASLTTTPSPRSSRPTSPTRRASLLKN